MIADLFHAPTKPTPKTSKKKLRPKTERIPQEQIGKDILDQRGCRRQLQLLLRCKNAESKNGRLTMLCSAFASAADSDLIAHGIVGRFGGDRYGSDRYGPDHDRFAPAFAIAGGQQ